MCHTAQTPQHRSISLPTSGQMLVGAVTQQWIASLRFGLRSLHSYNWHLQALRKAVERGQPWGRLGDSLLLNPVQRAPCLPRVSFPDDLQQVLEALSSGDSSLSPGFSGDVWCDSEVASLCLFSSVNNEEVHCSSGSLGASRDLSFSHPFFWLHRKLP